MIAFAILAVAAVLLLQYLTEVRALDALEVSHRPDRSMVEQEEDFALILTFTNRGLLPIPFLRFRETLPEDMVPTDDTLKVEKDIALRYCVVGTAWLGPRQSLERRIPVRALRRGRFTLQPLELRGGDFLGIKEYARTYGSFAEVVVYPHQTADLSREDVLGGLLGEMSVRRFLFEDPVLTIGCRDYTGREPMKAISWPQSAKTGKLMAKQYDYTAEPTVSVAVGMPSGGDEELKERCLSLARGVCEQLERRGVKYEFRMNALNVGGLSSWCQVNDGRGRGHLDAVLEGLGRADYRPVMSLERLIDHSVKDTDSSRGLILILPEPAPLGGLRRTIEANGGTLRALFAGEVSP